MQAESRLNVYILGARLSSKQRERIQAQVQTALRNLPASAFELLERTMDERGTRSLPVIIEPRASESAGGQVLGLGQIEGRPAVRLMPRLREASIEWGQDVRYLVAKAIAYMAAPAAYDANFWKRWRDAVDKDALRSRAAAVASEWSDSNDLGLLLEMFAAYVLNSRHPRWSDLPAVRAFLERWSQGDGGSHAGSGRPQSA